LTSIAKQTKPGSRIQNFLVQALPLVDRHEDGPRRVFDVSYHVDASKADQAASLVITQDKGTQWSQKLPDSVSGKNILEIRLPEQSLPTSQHWRLQVGELQTELRLEVQPARPWHVHISLHSHTDLGFTGSISEIAAIHADNTDQAMTLMDETAHWPPESQFRWTLEISWQLEQYLKLRGSEAINKLKKYLQSGHMELAAMYAGEHVDALGHEEAIRAFYLAAKYRRELGIPVDTAMLCDVPGSTEGLVQIMAKSGIKNFIIADNNFCAPVLKRTDLPRPFNWRSRSGDELTTWYTDHPFFAYIEGRNYGISESVAAARKKMPYRLLEQENKGYAHDLLHVQYAFDNFRIEFRPALVVREWNENWLWPKLELSTPRRFFNELRLAGNEIPTRSGDFNEWWTSTFNNYPVETSISKRLHDQIPKIETLANLFALQKGKSGSSNKAFSEIYHNLLGWDEHSGNGQIWEAEDPSHEKKALDEGYSLIYEAQKGTEHQEQIIKSGMAQAFSSATKDTVVVANSLTWSRGGLVLVEDFVPGECYCCHDFEGRALKHNLTANSEGLIKFQSVSVPALGYRTYEIVLQNDCGCQSSIEKGKDFKLIEEDGTLTLSNQFLQLRIDTETGEINHLKRLADNLVIHDSKDFPALGAVQFWESQLADPVQMGRYIRSYYEGVPGQPRQLEEPTDIQISIKHLNKIQDGVSGLEIGYDLEGYRWLTRRLSFDDTGRRLVLDYTFHHEGLASSGILDRLDHTAGSPNMIYIAFPFALQDSQFIYESTGMTLEAGDNQFKGSNHDFYAVHRWAMLKGKEAAVAVYPKDSLIVDPGNPSLFCFREQLPPDLNALSFRVMPSAGWSDRAWDMGYYQQDLQLHFELEGFAGGELSTSTDHVQRYGTERATPLLASRLDATADGALALGKGHLLDLQGHGLEISTIKPAESSDRDLIIRIRETMGQATSATLGSPGSKFHKVAECAITEEVDEWFGLVMDQKLELNFLPFEIKTIRYSPDQINGGNL
jgi:alpha-mannosidase